MSSPGIIWNLWIRGIHWLLAVIVIANLFILEDGDPPHRYVGYAAVALVILRFILGFVYTDHSAFKNFPLSFSKLKDFAYAKLHNQKIDYVGHNPAASWVYLAIWSCVICLGITGYMMGTDQFWGDETLEEIHNLFSVILQIFIVVHFAGIALDSMQFHRKTWLRMITGKSDNQN